MSVEQREAAMLRANEIKQARSAIRKQLRTGEKSVRDILAEPSCLTATLYSMLLCQWRWGERRTNRFFSELANRWHAPITPTRRICELTEREIDVLRRALERAA